MTTPSSSEKNDSCVARDIRSERVRPAIDTMTGVRSAQSAASANAKMIHVVSAPSGRRPGGPGSNAWFAIVSSA